MTDQRKIKGYGWRPDLPDHRDRFLTIEASSKNLPTKVDLRSKMPPVYDQGQLGSCTANAIGGAFEYEAMREGQKPWTPSRLFIYYNERDMEGTVSEDSGAMIRDGVKSVAKLGVPPETAWPYDIGRFAERPPQEAYLEALDHEATQYRRCTPNHVRWALGHTHSPVIFGFTVYSAFESSQVAQTGRLNLPGPHEEVLGGHAVLAVGYDDDAQRFIVRNSWSADWGQDGYFTMPYAYILNPQLASDFWTIRRVT